MKRRRLGNTYINMHLLYCPKHKSVIITIPTTVQNNILQYKTLITQDTHNMVPCITGQTQALSRADTSKKQYTVQIYSILLYSYLFHSVQCILIHATNAN